MNLNSNQKNIVITAGVIFILMGLFPPWSYTVGATVHSEKPAGYALIIAPPEPESKAAAFGVKLDFSRLIVQWMVLAALTW